MTYAQPTRRGPVVIEADLPDAVSPEDAAPVPEVIEGRAMQTVTAFAARNPSWLSRVFWAGVTGLIGMMITVAMWDFVTDLLARNLLLGQVAVGLTAIVGLVLIVIILRELAAFSRLAKIDTLRAQVSEAHTDGERGLSENVVKRLMSLYSGREELRWARKSVAEQQADMIDGSDVLGLAERELMGALDAAAVTEIQAASRNVAAVTALIPMALADVAVALAANVRMVRRIAEIYGGRAGTFGSWRLLRAVATHLVATGAVAVGDDLIGSVAGGGALSKVSRKFGEGVINGALTARVGVAAMEVCRPMPFEALKRPKVSGIIKNALVGLFK